MKFNTSNNSFRLLMVTSLRYSAIWSRIVLSVCESSENIGLTFVCAGWSRLRQCALLTRECISHHRERSEGDETCTTGVNSVQGRCRVINFGVRSDNSERSLPDSADRWQRSDRCFQCPLVSFHRQSYRGRMKNRFIYENDLQKNLRLLVERCQRV